MRRGFSLVEMLVTVAIILVLAALAVPAAGLLISRANSAKCVANLRGLGIGLNGYLADNNMVLPPLLAARGNVAEDVRVIDNTLNAYMGDMRAFTCPADPDISATTGTSYYWNSALSGQSLASLNFFVWTQPTLIPVLVDKEGWHRHTRNKVNHLFADGHVENQLRFSGP